MWEGGYTESEKTSHRHVSKNGVIGQPSRVFTYSGHFFIPSLLFFVTPWRPILVAYKYQSADRFLLLFPTLLLQDTMSAEFSAPTNLHSKATGNGEATESEYGIKTGLAQMFKVMKRSCSWAKSQDWIGVLLQGGVIMDVVNPEQARIAEEAGACAVMALERVPADIRKNGGVARMSDPKMIKGIQEAVTIPVMAKVRIGHFVEAQILEAIGVDYIDESEVLTPADESNHINKKNFKVPFVCGAKNLGEALRRINEGAAMIRTKGEAGTGNVVEAVRHMRTVNAEIRRAASMTDEELYAYAKEIQAPYHLLKETARLGRLPVVNFAAGGVATPADAALMMVSDRQNTWGGSVRLNLYHVAIGLRWCLCRFWNLQVRWPCQARPGYR